ncbi:hypothetical protein Tco_0954780 [Tanacetum coccineum]|uniref:Uncharacterized protein n=1 Tax=Tanacetum coccineum TaxID=301880 RepID=A0ABQ5E5C1_9ASTR
MKIEREEEEEIGSLETRLNLVIKNFRDRKKILARRSNVSCGQSWQSQGSCDGEDGDKGGELIALGESGGEALCDRGGEGGLEKGRYGVSYRQSSIRRIGDFLEHGYAVSSLMDTAYWLSEHYGGAGLASPLSGTSLENSWGATLKSPIKRLISLLASLYELRHTANHPCGDSTLVGHRSLYKFTQTPDILM